MMEVVSSLKLEEKLLPTRNREIAWCYLFLPALIGYFIILTSYINSKPFIGEIEMFHDSFKNVIFPNTKMEVIASGSKWAEGPVWIEDEGLGYLLYSDTKLNRIMRWEEGKGFFTVGKTIYINRSGGCKSNHTQCDNILEPGSNGLLRMNPALIPPTFPTGNDILACQHGERAISLLLQNGTRIMIATHYNGKRFNSPNDMVWSPEGNLYFTDPDYGLILTKNVSNEQIISNEKELKFSGVYMIRKIDIEDSVYSGKPTDRVILLESKLTKPNGLAFSPDFSKLYVSNSDPFHAICYVFDISLDTGMFSNKRIFFDTIDLFRKLKYPNLSAVYSECSNDDRSKSSEKNDNDSGLLEETVTKTHEKETFDMSENDGEIVDESFTTATTAINGTDVIVEHTDDTCKVGDASHIGVPDGLKVDITG